MTSSGQHQATSPQSITKSPISTRIYLPRYSRWLQTIRKLLQRLSKGFVSDEEALELNITINELQDPPARVLSEAVTTIIAAQIQTKLYLSGRRSLAISNFHKVYQARGCGNYISSLLMACTREIAEEAGGHVEVLFSLFTRECRLHIAEDSRTRGVRPSLIIVSKGGTQQLPLLAIDRRKEPIEKGLTSIELYTLLAIASKKYLADPSADDSTIYQADMWSIYFNWVQRISAKIPSSYMRSMIQGQRALSGRMEIWRGPSLNFYEDATPPKILREIFECCEVACATPLEISTATPATQNPKKRKSTAEDDKEGEEKRQRR